MSINPYILQSGHPFIHPSKHPSIHPYFPSYLFEDKHYLFLNL
jgi:hypothetical protein